MEQSLSPELFHHRVTHTFGKRKSKLCELRGAVLALPDLADGPVVTTNFDHILERVFAEAGSPFEQVVWGSQVDLIRRAIVENEPFLLKIHGDAEERSGRVLTKCEYEKHYAPGDPDGLRAQLGRVFQGRTLLFVGCSLGTGPDDGRSLRGSSAGVRPGALRDRREAGRGRRILRQDSVARRARHSANLVPNGTSTSSSSRCCGGSRASSLRARRPGRNWCWKRPSQRKHEVRSELDLLIPYQRTTTFVGRREMFESMQAWSFRGCGLGAGGHRRRRLGKDAAGGGTRRVARAGGAGAVELRVSDAGGNRAVLGVAKPLAVAQAQAGAGGGGLRGGVGGEAARVARATVGGERRGAKLRLLLLEREASLESGWLASTISRGSSASAVRAMFDPPEPVRLEAVAEAADRRSVLQATVDAGAALRRVTPPRVPAAGVDAWFDRKHRGAAMGRSADADDGGVDGARHRSGRGAGARGGGPGAPAGGPGVQSRGTVRQRRPARA